MDSYVYDPITHLQLIAKLISILAPTISYLIIYNKL